MKRFLLTQYWLWRVTRTVDDSENRAVVSIQHKIFKDCNAWAFEGRFKSKEKMVDDWIRNILYPDSHAQG